MISFFKQRQCQICKEIIAADGGRRHYITIILMVLEQDANYIFKIDEIKCKSFTTISRKKILKNPYHHSF